MKKLSLTEFHDDLVAVSVAQNTNLKDATRTAVGDNIVDLLDAYNEYRDASGDLTAINLNDYSVVSLSI